MSAPWPRQFTEVRRVRPESRRARLVSQRRDTESVWSSRTSAVGVTVPSYDEEPGLKWEEAAAQDPTAIDGQSQRSEARQAQVTLLTRGMDACRAVF